MPTDGYASRHGRPGYWRDITRHLPVSGRVLDVGCGTGWLAEHVRQWYGVDVDVPAVMAAGTPGRIARVDLDRGLPFLSASFDAVVCKDVLEHVVHPVALVDEIARVLRPGGLVLASSPDAQRWVWHDYTHRRPFTRRAYRLLFADRGFDVLTASYESVAPGTSIIAGMTRSNRRPAPLRALAWLPVVRRNVWVLAQRPPGTP